MLGKVIGILLSVFQGGRSRVEQSIQATTDESDSSSNMAKQTRETGESVYGKMFSECPDRAHSTTAMVRIRERIHQGSIDSNYPGFGRGRIRKLRS